MTAEEFYEQNQYTSVTNKKDLTDIMEAYANQKVLEALEKVQQNEKTVTQNVEILKDTLAELMTSFDSEEDRMDFILDICNGYKKRLEKYDEKAKQICYKSGVECMHNCSGLCKESC